MDLNLLRDHLAKYVEHMKNDPDKFEKDLEERKERIAYYQSCTADKILKMTEEDFYEYLSKLWAMLIWGNKHYKIDKILLENGLGEFRNELAQLVWGNESIVDKWDNFRTTIKGMGPAMMSEILCHTHPVECMHWYRRAYVGLNYLGVKNLPRYDYQMTGKKYSELSSVAKDIAIEMEKFGIQKTDLLTVDYFIWDELQVEDKLSQIYKKKKTKDVPKLPDDKETSDFIHNEVRDKIADIGQWLGFKTYIEKNVAEGSRVDAVWETSIGNMGRIIYVFEVQTKGSIDGLILNLLKSMNNPAVQGVVAVSDKEQLEKIKRHAENVGDLSKKLRYWDYEEVLQNHEALELVNESINRLGLVPPDL